jgi:hypothetical protein
MRTAPAIVLLVIAILCAALPAFAQPPRLDVMWARRSSTPITLDGVLNEPAWAVAESVRVQWAQDSGIPGSGFKNEGGVIPVPDPTDATLKLLVYGNQMYLGARMKDTSVGGSQEFNRFDGLLMSIKDHLASGFPKGPIEYFYAWWNLLHADPQPVGQLPLFAGGAWITLPIGSPRTPAQIDAWDAVTVVQGISNSDAVPDQGYTVEMKFNLTPMGYDVTKLQGDIVEWNCSVYDCDGFWPTTPAGFSANRAWFQSPWGNAMWYDEVRVFARPDVTDHSGPVPQTAPEVYIANGATFATPNIDGTLNESVWAALPGFDIRYNDEALRRTYPGVGPNRSGQYQPPVLGGMAAVIDPGDATVKMFYKDTTLYLGFDVRDKVVQYQSAFDRWDGFLVSINEYALRGADNNLKGEPLSFEVGPAGTAIPRDFLFTLVNAGGAQVAIALKAGTVVDTLGIDVDTGYTAELAVDLTRLGYPADLGDHRLFIGIDMLDGDSFSDPLPVSDSYGTRTWWFREREDACCPAWGYLSPAFVTAVGDPPVAQPESSARLFNYPNPASALSTIRYALTAQTRVTLQVYDVRGRLVEQRDLGVQTPGSREALFDGGDKAAGVYMYRLQLQDPVTGALRSTMSGRTVVVR